MPVLFALLLTLIATPIYAFPCTEAPGTISTLAGNGTNGYSGDGGAATSAQLTTVYDVALDTAGNVYLCDQGASTIRKVEVRTGLIRTIAGNGTAGFTPDGFVAAGMPINQPVAVVVARNGDVYFTEHGTYRVRVIVAATGRLASIAGNGANRYGGDGGSARDASFSDPSDLVLDAAGNLYICDATDNRIRKVDAASGMISTVAGPGVPGTLADGGPATSGWLNRPTGIAMDRSRNLYICEFFNRRIRKVDPSTGVISTVAGNGTSGFAGDGGPATSANLSPWAVTVDPGENIFIIDQGNQRIRMVRHSDGIINTVVGTGVGSYGGDGGPATSAQVNAPEGAVVDHDGNLIFVDTNNDRVRMVCGLGVNGVREAFIPPSILDMRLAPNPAQETVLISATGVTGKATVKIHDIYGMSVRTWELSADDGLTQVKWNLLDQSERRVTPGTYTVRIETAIGVREGLLQVVR